ncbi:MAG: efflux RND transporter periplasmic adaptor subunit [Algicola sp.]|nr:efflux RND transporter periplasmic adaptor subunit [Algicola sp.]
MVFYAWSLISSNGSTVSADRSDFIFSTVTKGNLVRDIRAPGTLQPTTLRWIAASSPGRIEQIFVEPGAKVDVDTVIMSLSNPKLARDVETATFALEVAEAEFVALQKRLESNYLAQEAVISQYKSSAMNANFRVEANEALAGKQIVSKLDVKETKLLQIQYTERLAIERKRLTHLEGLHVAELKAKQAQINQTRSQLRLQQQLLANLQVKAGLNGILQQVPVEQGQQISEGVILARVAREDNLKAELKVQESQVANIMIGQKVTISAGGQQAIGKVQRIEPAVQNGVVIVDVFFSGDKLASARPDLRVDGVIEIERLENVLLLKRPVYSKENRATKLYVVSQSSDTAKLSSVSLGSGSLDMIQVITGLKAGDQVIVSDTSQFEQQSIITLQ